MKKLVLASSLALSLSLNVLADPAPATPAAATPAAAPVSPADAAYAHLQEVRTARIPRMDDVKASSALQMKQHDQASRLAEQFINDFPNDPRKWEVVATAISSPRTYAPGDPAAAQWEIRRNELSEQFLNATGVPDQTWASTMERYADSLDGFRGTPIKDLPKAKHVIDVMATRVPDSSRRVFTETAYMEALKKTDPDAEIAFLKTRIMPSETNQPVREMAEGNLRIIEGKKTPLELSFTAADGRKVDLAQLRGKVVLIDFWATWCVPCMQEMPNVEAAYQKYHDQGFEVVGISFDRTPGEKPNRIDKTTAQLLDFTQKHQMPWPQYFDGKYWSNDMGKRFAIAEIPASFLLGKDGRIVTTEARGEKLAPEIERLLKQ